MTPPRRGDEGARGRSRTSDVRLSGTGAPAVERRALVLLNVEQTGREASRCLRRESNPRLRFRRAASCPSDHEGSAFRRRRTTNAHRRRREQKGSTRNAPRPGAFPHKKKAAPAVSGTACRTTLWSDDRTAGVAGEERGHAEIRHGQHDVPLLAGQHGTSPVLLDGFAHGTAPLGHVGVAHAPECRRPRKTVRAFARPHNPISRIHRNSPATRPVAPRGTSHAFPPRR